MKKKCVVLFCLLCSSIFFINAATKVNTKVTTDRNGKKMRLVWSDEFNNKKSVPNPKKWVRCKRQTSDWNNYMSDREDLVQVKNGMLTLRGIVNPNKEKDPVPFLTGGVTTLGKFSFKYGKIEICAKFDSAQGCWPALWMLGNEGGWPNNGEMDLMEHLNFDTFIYQTIHSGYTNSVSKSNPKAHATPKINHKEFNTYGAEWDENGVTFTVNGKPTHSYPKLADKGENQYPFIQPFYIIMSMQIEGAWVGKAKPEQYPVEMIIDWVRVYSYR